MNNNYDPNYDYQWGHDSHYNTPEMEPEPMEHPSMDEMVAMMERDEWETMG